MTSTVVGFEQAVVGSVAWPVERTAALGLGSILGHTDLVVPIYPTLDTKYAMGLRMMLPLPYPESSPGSGMNSSPKCDASVDSSAMSREFM